MTNESLLSTAGKAQVATLFEASEDLIEAGQKCRTAFWALRGMEATDAVHHADTFAAVAEVVDEARQAIERARRACFPEEFEPGTA